MRISSVIILLTAITLSGCNGANTSVNSNGSSNANANKAQILATPQPIKPVETADPKFKPCNPYFPLVPGSIAKYVINYPTGLVADLTVVVDSGEEGGRKIFIQRSQIVDRSGGMEITQSTIRKFVCDGARVQILSEKTETNVTGQRSSTDLQFRENSVTMEAPQSIARKGTTWQQAWRQTFQRPGEQPTQADVPTIVIFEVLGPEDVSMPAGSFKAVKIHRKVGDSFTYDYYAPGIGLIKRQSKDGASWELKEYSGLKVED
jgi:hypothetical protein